MTNEHFDVLVVGAGISGIGAGHYLQERCANKSYAILERRAALGGTWDLFRYPGIRSDSDMYTLGYAFRPWTGAKSIADGPAILDYLQATARDEGIDRQIRFNHRVLAANWSTPDARWTVDLEVAGERRSLTTNFLFMCSGYYNYDAGYLPEFPGIDSYKGEVVHPQKWTPEIVHAGKRVIVIGSGATAVTLVPEMAKTAAHVTMLQRSPSYVVSRPGEDSIGLALRKVLPSMLAYQLTRWKNVLLGMYFFRLMRKYPAQAKARLVGMVRDELGPDYDVEKHFSPSYNPWDQRVCAVPNADMFEAIRSGKASVETDTIETFNATGIRLKSGKQLDADMIVTATGLDMQLMGGARLSVDGVAVEISKALTYKGMMFSDIPNLALSTGYTNASWTLKTDLTCAYVCRLLQHMDATGTRQCTPRITDAEVQPAPFIDFSSGYIQRAAAHLPKQGNKAPWKLHQNYALDIVTLRFGKVDDGTMEFGNAGPAPRLDVAA
ncbi:MAG: flavin-containing monooxygenase [Polymorphobacter sp.]